MLDGTKWTGAVLFAVMLALVSCESASGPPADVQPRVTGHVVAVRLVPAPGGSHSVECDVVYELQPGTRTVEWRHAMFQFHFGADRSQIDELIHVSGEHLEQSWELLQLDGRTILGSEWQFGSPVPFSLTAELAYGYEGESTARALRPRLSCGPEPSASDSVPTISGAVTPLDGLSAGAELRIGYQARSSLGLWETAIHITGAWQAVIRYPEDFQKSAGREIVVTVPPHAVAGQPVNVVISALDAALRTSFVSFTTEPVAR